MLSMPPMALIPIERRSIATCGPLADQRMMMPTIAARHVNGSHKYIVTPFGRQLFLWRVHATVEPPPPAAVVGRRDSQERMDHLTHDTLAVDG
jgi:hypothetical protein